MVTILLLTFGTEIEFMNYPLSPVWAIGHTAEGYNIWMTILSLGLQGYRVKTWNLVATEQYLLH